MSEILFPAHKTCTNCSLCESAVPPGLPTRTFLIPNEVRPSRAILIVGEAPGYNEDQESTSWVGNAGKVLASFLTASKLPDHAEVYLSNACRCRPPSNSTPTQGQVHTCRQHLITDIAILLEAYDKLIILCCGASATRSVAAVSTLTSAFKLQGHPGGNCKPLATTFSASDCSRINVFFTYHPAILLPGRKPALVHAVEAHFMLLLRFLQGRMTPNTLKFNEHFGLFPNLKTVGKVVSVDIETYGILKSIEQTVFHPIKSIHVDKIPLGKQVVTISFCYRNTETDELEAYQYVFQWRLHLGYVHKWLQHAIKNHITLLGQNIPFDVQYMAANDTVLAALLQPSLINLDDTMILSFLQFEQRPERGLKELAKLFGIADYDKLTLTAKTGTAASHVDPALHYYNSFDAAATITLYEELLLLLPKKYGSRTTKTSELCSSFRNELLWTTIKMSQAGFTVSVPDLIRTHHTLENRTNTQKAFCKKHDLIIAGTGSQKSTLSFFEKLVNDIGLTDSPQLELTEKKKDISLGANNTNLIMNNLDDNHSDRLILQAYSDYVSDSKIIGTYTKPILTTPAKGIVHTAVANKAIGYCYPAWFPTPRFVGRESRGSSGGTIQARFSCKSPAAQTFPPSIKKTIRSRWPQGKINVYDLSQIELRMAGFLSNDYYILEDYKNDSDLHTSTAMLIDPSVAITSEEFLAPHGLRALGKTVNFLVIYKGGAYKLQQTALEDLGLHLDLNFCKSIIANYYRRHSGLLKWQNSLIEQVRQRGFIEMPTGWSRNFATGTAAIESYRNEICNYPIQTTAAQIMQSAQYAIMYELHKRRFRSTICLQIHDSLLVDTLPAEESSIEPIIDKYLTRPPLFVKLELMYGRTVPLKYSKESL